MDLKRIELLSVGIDVGSSTSHLVFSRLLLIRNDRSPSLKFEIRDRRVIYEGRIIDTPLLDDNTIDMDRLTAFIGEEIEHAGIKTDEIDTGAVIVTGETAKKQNAPRIAEFLSQDSGKFVAATAGPNFESLLAAMGSGATARSQEQNKTILSCDIGGGTSNLAISRNGEVISTCCISVGGRLLAVDKEGRISRLNDPAVKVMQDIGLAYRNGDFLPREDMQRIAARLAEALVEAMTGTPSSALTKELMVTEALNLSGGVDEYIFSGGVAEFIYGGTGEFNDLGRMLAAAINTLMPPLGVPVVEPANKIRATVIGAGAYSLSISGSSGFMDDALVFPMRNIPLLRVDVEQSRLSFEHVVSQIKLAFQRYDFVEGRETVALYFRDPVKVNLDDLELFARSVESALANSIRNKIPVILIFEKDVACSVGNVIRRETSLKENLLSLDELSLNDGDWIDISEPLVGRQVFPVTVKSLVFHNN